MRLPWPLRAKPLRFGRRAEIEGALYLRTLGYKLLACPFQPRPPGRGEIDIVADDAGCLVFVEVKARRRDSHPEDAVNRRKRARILAAARSYRRLSPIDGPYRFDILAVVERANGSLSFRLIPDAFADDTIEA